MAVQVTPKTAEELCRLPDDGLCHELVRGELRVSPPPGAEHGRVASNVDVLLGTHARQSACGVTFGAETGFLLASDPDTVRAPDAAFVSAERANAVGRTERYWPGAPDLAVEVLSPGDSFREVEAKALDWLRGGSIAVLVLDPARRTATVYRGQGDARVHCGEDAVDLSDAVPGWRVALPELFL